MNASEINTDYLVVGAGAAGMAITDELLTHSNASITIVDRRHAPGGHWIDAYPYVRLHQPSAFGNAGKWREAPDAPQIPAVSLEDSTALSMRAFSCASASNTARSTQRATKRHSNWSNKLYCKPNHA